MVYPVLGLSKIFGPIRKMHAIGAFKRTYSGSMSDCGTDYSQLRANANKLQG
jgi:hypothetical protein